MKRDMAGLLIYLVLFGAVLVASIYAFLSSSAIIKVGLPSGTIDLFVAALSAIGMGKTLYHILKF